MKIAMLGPWAQECGIAGYGQTLRAGFEHNGHDVVVLGNYPYMPIYTPDDDKVFRCFHVESRDHMKDFDYNAFQKENGLKPEIFSSVKAYLGNGEIRKLYYDFSSTIEDIISLLKQVKGQLDAGNFTPVKEIWKLNGLFSESLLFGQYVSQVLYNIQGI